MARRANSEFVVCQSDFHCSQSVYKFAPSEKMKKGLFEQNRYTLLIVFTVGEEFHESHFQQHLF